MSERLRTGVPLWVNRHFPPEMMAQTAQQIAGSGAADDLYLWDQMTSWWPRSLWTPENAPLAESIPDYDSFPDVIGIGGYVTGQAPESGLVISEDALRRGPSELVQTMLTMADLTKGRTTFMLGAGEMKQCQPFGWKRAEGLRRLEDLLKIFHLYWDNDGPVDFEGQMWTLDQAWLGGAKAHRPKLWVMGGGPKIIDLATSYADGFITCIPWVWTSPEHAAEQIDEMKRQLESKGRDPEAFDFSALMFPLMHEDPAFIQQALDNPLIKWITAIWGRINMADWDQEGLEPPFPRDWHYAMKMLPMKITAEEADAVLAKVPQEMSEKSWFRGTPAEVAEQMLPYAEAGITWMSPCDCLALILAADEFPAAMGRTLELCSILKSRGRTASGKSAAAAATAS